MILNWYVTPVYAPLAILLVDRDWDFVGKGERLYPNFVYWLGLAPRELEPCFVFEGVPCGIVDDKRLNDESTSDEIVEIKVKKSHETLIH